MSTILASPAGTPRKPSGPPVPSASPSRAYSVPATVAAYATSTARPRFRHSSAMPKTSSTWASAPHTGRCSAGTKSDSGVRSSPSHTGSSARTAPRFCTTR